MQWPVRIGHPNGTVSSAFDLSSPEYAAAVGLLLWGLHRGAKPRTLEPAKTGVGKRILDYLKSFLPVSS
jgi:hypothetical protein